MEDFDSKCKIDPPNGKNCIPQRGGLDPSIRIRSELKEYIDKTFEKINDRFNQMNARFDRIEIMIKNLIGNVQEQNKSCSRMDSHINFVEDTYETLRSPLDFITSKINIFRGLEDTPVLPRIEYVI